MTTLLHISDLHYERVPERLSVGVGERLRRARVALRSRAFDVLAVSGDLTSYGTWDVRELVEARHWLEGFDRPMLVVPGNHDLGANPERAERFPVFERYEPLPWNRTNFGMTFGEGPLVVRATGDLLVVGIGLRRGDPDGALTLLEHELTCATTPVVVVGHYPLVPVRRSGVLATFGAMGYVDAEVAQLHRLMVDSRRVIAYLCGHVHAASASILDSGLLQLSAGALGPGPALGWLVHVDRDEVRFEQVEAPGRATFWPSDQLGGADPVAYHAGEVRSGVVPLGQNGRPTLVD